ncbi:MAG: esterase family protein [Defluviitaleaceae bacterium]|nr:esterase family protein [Defluviitaleaceae bacterium]
MARLSTSIRSAALGLNTHVEVIFPQANPEGVITRRVLYLLHGMTGNSSCWVNNSRITHHIHHKHPFIVVMPEVQNSFYTDMKHGADYFTYVAYELPKIVEEIFNVKHTRENTYVAGLSMGGYGAVKCALTRPEFYCAVASFSGAVDAESIYHRLLPGTDERHKKLAVSIAGEELKVPEGGNLFALASNLADKPEKPRILVTCGDKDFLLEDNRRFDAHMKALPFEYAYKEWAGDHDWDFWEESLPVMFDFFNSEGEFA